MWLKSTVTLNPEPYAWIIIFILKKGAIIDSIN